MHDSDSVQFYVFHCDSRGGLAAGMSVIDPTTATVVRTTKLTGGVTFPGDPVIHPEGRQLYVPDIGGIRVVDTETLVQSTTLAVRARYVSVSPDGGRLYATSGDDHDGVLEVDTSTGTIVRALAEFGAGFAGSLPSRDGGRLYLGSAREQPKVWVLDLVSGELGESVEIGAVLGDVAGATSVRLALAADDRTLYAWGRATGRLVAIDTATFTVTARREWIGEAISVDDFGDVRTVPIGGGPVDVVVAADGREVIAAFGKAGGVVLDPATLVDRQELPVRGTVISTRICLGPDGTVCASEEGVVAVISPGRKPGDRREVSVPGMATRAVAVTSQRAW